MRSCQAGLRADAQSRRCSACMKLASGALHRRTIDVTERRSKKGQRSCVENRFSIKCQRTGPWSPGFVHCPHLHSERPSGVDLLRIAHPESMCLQMPIARSILRSS